MKNFLRRFSLLGLIFVFIHAILVLLIPLWIKIFPQSHSCGIFPCIFSDGQSLFFLFNLPGMLSSFLFLPFLQWLKPREVKLSGKFTMVDYIPVYIISAIFYYFLGAILQFILQMVFCMLFYRLKIRKDNFTSKR